MATVLRSPLVAPRILRRSQARSDHQSAPAQPAPYRPSAAEEEPAANRVQIVNHPAALHALTQLRNKHTPRYDFRTTSYQLLALLAMEATRTLPLRDQRIETNGNPAVGPVLAKSLVFLSVTRDGLGLSHNLTDCLPGLLVGSIGIERVADSQVYQSRLHLASAPALSESRVFLFDPVVHTGNSADIAINLVRQLGATDICLLSFMVSSQGLLRLQSRHPDLTVWTTGIDEEWNAKHPSSGILADFRSRLFA